MKEELQTKLNEYKEKLASDFGAEMSRLRRIR